MKRYRKWPMAIIVLIITLFCFSDFAYAQPDPGDDPDAPIDGGIGILIAAGIGYGIKKLKKKNIEFPSKN